MKKFTGKTLTGRVVSVHVGGQGGVSKEARKSLMAEIGGFDGDKHSGPARAAWSTDWEPEGTRRRNERQWSAVSVEELAIITERLELVEPLEPGTIGANLCLEGVADLSLLPKGTKLVFPSGAVLVVEEHCVPCADMGARVAEHHATRSGTPLSRTDWLRPAAGRRGLLGVIDVPGAIEVGDGVEIRVYEVPEIRRF